MDILQSSSAAPLAPREAANAPAQQAGGSFQGERVHYVSVSQSLADAAEELTFAFSERAEKSLAKRRLSDAHARLSEVQAMLQEYWKRIPDLESQQKLEALIAHLGSGQLSSLAQLSAYLEGFSSEISQRFLALSRARDVLAGRPEARAMLALVDQALLRMADEQGLEIELGLRIEPLAAEASAAVEPARSGEAGAGHERHAQAARARRPGGAGGGALAGAGDRGAGPWHTGLLN